MEEKKDTVIKAERRNNINFSDNDKNFMNKKLKLPNKINNKKYKKKIESSKKLCNTANKDIIINIEDNKKIDIKDNNEKEQINLSEILLDETNIFVNESIKYNIEIPLNGSFKTQINNLDDEITTLLRDNIKWFINEINNCLYLFVENINKYSDKQIKLYKIITDLKISNANSSNKDLKFILFDIISDIIKYNIDESKTFIKRYELKDLIYPIDIVKRNNILLHILRQINDKYSNLKDDNKNNLEELVKEILIEEKVIKNKELKGDNKYILQEIVRNILIEEKIVENKELKEKIINVNKNVRHNIKNIYIQFILKNISNKSINNKITFKNTYVVRKNEKKPELNKIYNLTGITDISSIIDRVYILYNESYEESYKEKYKNLPGIIDNKEEQIYKPIRNKLWMFMLTILVTYIILILSLVLTDTKWTTKYIIFLILSIIISIILYWIGIKISTTSDFDNAYLSEIGDKPIDATNYKFFCENKPTSCCDKLINKVLCCCQKRLPCNNPV